MSLDFIALRLSMSVAPSLTGAILPDQALQRLWAEMISVTTDSLTYAFPALWLGLYCMQQTVKMAFMHLEVISSAQGKR